MMQKKNKTAVGASTPAAKKAKIANGTPAVAQTPVEAGSLIGEVRFGAAASAQQALQLSGQALGGQPVMVELDARSADGTKCKVLGLNETVTKHDLKTFFSSCGNVAFADVKAVRPTMGTVRFTTAIEAQTALGLNGANVNGYEIQVQMNAGSKDGTKLSVFNLPPDFGWHDLKDYFTQAGAAPVFTETNSGKANQTAEVRFDSPQVAQSAVASLNQSWLCGCQITVALDPNSKDGAKLLVSGVGPGTGWQELKDHFGQVGAVAFTKVNEAGQGPAANVNPLLMGGMGGMMMGGMGGMGMGGMGMGGMGMGGMMPMGGMAMGGMGGMAAMGGGCGGGRTGEVRFDSPQSAMVAIQALNGSALGGQQIQVAADTSSVDGTKVTVTGLAPGVGWQDLKDLFKQAGNVAFAGIK